MPSENKLLSTKSVPAVEGGRTGGNNSGPTGSNRNYKKSGQKAAAPSMDANKFNPMNGGKSTFGLEGV